MSYLPQTVSQPVNLELGGTIPYFDSVAPPPLPLDPTNVPQPSDRSREQFDFSRINQHLEAELAVRKQRAAEAEAKVALVLEAVTTNTSVGDEPATADSDDMRNEFFEPEVEAAKPISADHETSVLPAASHQPNMRLRQYSPQPHSARPYDKAAAIATANNAGDWTTPRTVIDEALMATHPLFQFQPTSIAERAHEVGSRQPTSGTSAYTAPPLKSNYLPNASAPHWLQTSNPFLTVEEGTALLESRTEVALLSNALGVANGIIAELLAKQRLAELSAIAVPEDTDSSVSDIVAATKEALSNQVNTTISSLIATHRAELAAVAETFASERQQWAAAANGQADEHGEEDEERSSHLDLQVSLVRDTLSQHLNHNMTDLNEAHRAELSDLQTSFALERATWAQQLRDAAMASELDRLENEAMRREREVLHSSDLRKVDEGQMQLNALKDHYEDLMARMRTECQQKLDAATAREAKSAADASSKLADYHQAQEAIQKKLRDAIHIRHKEDDAQLERSLRAEAEIGLTTLKTDFEGQIRTLMLERDWLKETLLATERSVRAECEASAALPLEELSRKVKHLTEERERLKASLLQATDDGFSAETKLALAEGQIAGLKAKNTILSENMAQTEAENEALQQSAAKMRGAAREADAKMDLLKEQHDGEMAALSDQHRAEVEDLRAALLSKQAALDRCELMLTDQQRSNKGAVDEAVRNARSDAEARATEEAELIVAERMRALVAEFEHSVAVDNIKLLYGDKWLDQRAGRWGTNVTSPIFPTAADKNKNASGVLLSPSHHSPASEIRLGENRITFPSPSSMPAANLINGAHYGTPQRIDRQYSDGYYSPNQTAASSRIDSTIRFVDLSTSPSRLKPSYAQKTAVQSPTPHGRKSAADYMELHQPTASMPMPATATAASPSSEMDQVYSFYVPPKGSTFGNGINSLLDAGLLQEGIGAGHGMAAKAGGWVQ